ncbi:MULTISPECIES: hypothetical protein [unclassified Pseudomonas]|uniref:hypothetical protein n=1 Tax=unclassified Pseudomonas TaxID=196821 RepID=UPI0015A3119A|nr:MULTISPECIES: hypothetical protein [unclassified Pseudomonas]NWC96424.1 hypothetical protein [Pseudomonas sp. IPO3779]NWD20658.1 hypothetical protein [Pseudomonas sp. IPO3778]
MEKPIEVKRAIQCVLLSFALGIVSILMDLPRLEMQGLTLGMAFVVALLVSIFPLILLYNVYKGRNWARIIFTIMIVAGSISTLSSIPGQIVRSPLIGMILSLQTLLQFFAVWLLFTWPGKGWFMKNKLLIHTSVRRVQRGDSPPGEAGASGGVDGLATEDRR